MYKELKKRQKEEFDTLPLHAAFGQEQINRKLQELGFSEDHNADNYYGKHIVSLGFGVFILKKDLGLYNEMAARHEKERQEAISGDKTGMGFIKEMFVSELYDHEYGLTEDPTDTLLALGMTPQTLSDNPILMKGFQTACREVVKGTTIGY